MLLAVTLCAGLSIAQGGDSNGWETSLGASLGMTQATYSENWTGGEIGSIIWAANLHATAQKQLSDKFRSENELKLEFGQTHNQNQDTKEWASPMKSTDKIRLDAILKYTPGGWLDPYVAGIFQSQFYNATYPEKKFYVDPIELTESVGASRTLYEDDLGKATTRLGFGLRQNLWKVYDAVNDETTSESTWDGGIEWVTDWTKQLNETLNYTTKLSVFQALFYSEEDEAGIGDEWKSTDVAWENLVTAKVYSVIQVSLAWELRYDEEVSTAGRFKETLALGVAYTL